MMEHSPSFRQKARSLSSTHGLKTSERRLGSVGATAREGEDRKTELGSTDRYDEKKSLHFNYLFHKHCKSRLYSLTSETGEPMFLKQKCLFFILRFPPLIYCNSKANPCNTVLTAVTYPGILKHLVFLLFVASALALHQLLHGPLQKEIREMNCKD